jgi:hypothetical protein
MVLNYIIHLKKNAKQSVGKAKRGEILVNSRYYLHGIQSFLDFNEIMLNWKKIIKYCPEEVSNNSRGYTRERRLQSSCQRLILEIAVLFC